MSFPRSDAGIPFAGEIAGSSPEIKDAVYATFLSDSDILTAESMAISKNESNYSLKFLISNHLTRSVENNNSDIKLDVYLEDGCTYRFMLVKDGLPNSIGSTGVKSGDYNTTLSMPKVELDGEPQYKKTQKMGISMSRSK